MHKREIVRLAAKVHEKGYTVIPTEIYSVRGKIKVNLALAKGKRDYDKREATRRRDEEREMQVEARRRR